MRVVVGLRPRLLLALVLTSAVTLGAAALALLPPLRDRLRTESVRSATATTLASRPSLERALRRGDDNAVFSLALGLTNRINAQVMVADDVPRVVADTSVEAPSDALDVQTALNTGRTSQIVRGDLLHLSVPLAPARRCPYEEHNSTTHACYVLVVRKPLTDVAGAVGQVRDAFMTAALVGLVIAVVLGLGLASTLLRRLARLRRAALRVTAEGPGAPPPADDGADEVGDLSRAFRTMQQELRRQEDARRTFVATASHELRTPLTSLQGMLELLDDDLGSGRVDLPDAREQVAAAQRELRRLANLATELLDLSRLDAGVPLRSEPVELGELSRAVVSEFEPRAAAVAVELEVVPPIGPCWAGGDPTAIARILRILLDNALRFSPAGTSVLVSTGYRGERTVLEVGDAGPGVPEDERDLIFQRFQRGSRTGGESGFGLGLAIGRELAERLGGALRLVADGAPGAHFVCELPIELPSGGRDAGATATRAPGAAS